jgi:hypothetical protein
MITLTGEFHPDSLIEKLFLFPFFFYLQPLYKVQARIYSSGWV